MVSPLRFPGGSIGELAVNGTVNDLAVSGARPLALVGQTIAGNRAALDWLRGEQSVFVPEENRERNIKLIEFTRFYADEIAAIYA